jgi:hypothetical protein
MRRLGDGGVLYLAGAAVRPAAAVMLVNFLFALAIAHRDTPLEADMPPLAMRAVALFLLFNGAGALSVDRWRTRRQWSGRLKSAVTEFTAPNSDPVAGRSLTATPIA